MNEVKKQIFNDVWFLYKRHIGAVSDADWEALMTEEKTLQGKHHNDRFLNDLLYAIIRKMTILERRKD